MKKSLLLSGMIALITTTNTHTTEQGRPEIYQKIDSIVATARNWGAAFDDIFALLKREKNTVDINDYRSGDKQQTLLYIAVDKSNLRDAEKLLKEYHANPNLGDRKKTPLMNASSSEEIPMIKLLLKYGANPYLKDDEGLTSFDYVDDDYPDDAHKILKLLNSYEKR